jgi:hypothetical protein
LRYTAAASACYVRPVIFVSGTKRSGTSMWMQIFAAGGFPVLGQAFPRGWDRTIKDANPDGFYESILRNGVYYRTNPHPATGQYFLPEHVEGYVVKVFVPGVVRSERAYISLLVANLRPWREYVASIERLYAMEQAKRQEHDPNAEAPLVFPPVYEWWMENFALVRDISLRRYEARLWTYEQVLSDPERCIATTFELVGRGDVESACAAVKPSHRTQDESSSLHDAIDVAPEHAQVFDDLYAAIQAGTGIPKSLLVALNETNRTLLPLLTDLQTKVARDTIERAPRERAKPEPVAGLPRLRP